MPDIKLYGYSTSPYVRKVGCYLYYKDLPFEFVPVNPLDHQQLAFTGKKTQVPVLKIDDEWRVDSTPLGIWLDELFPEKPLLGDSPEQREQILAIDRWVTDGMIAAAFRSIIDGEMDLSYRQQCWRLAAIVNSQTPMPEEVRAHWGEGLKQAEFIQRIADSTDRTEPLDSMFRRLLGELVAHLQDGPYLGGLEQPSLADFSLYPQLVFGYMAGLVEDLSVAEHPQIRAWLQRVSKQLPANPILVPDFMLVNQTIV